MTLTGDTPPLFLLLLSSHLSPYFSIIYTSLPGEWTPPTGSYLGQLTDELVKPYGEGKSPSPLIVLSYLMVLHVCSGSYICEFVAGGPKNYAYRVITGEGEHQADIKIRGFTMSDSTGKILNFYSLKNSVIEYVQKGCVQKRRIFFNQIRRKEAGVVHTVPTQKDHRVVYDKRVLKSDFSTLPYGY